MKKWLMNMPVSPEKDTKGKYSQAWLDWVKSVHPKNTEHHVSEWTEFLKGKAIGRPTSKARTRETYEALGWVGIYEGDDV